MARATILVVDDEPKIRELVRSYLEREGHIVFDTACGNDAVRIAQRIRPISWCLTSGCPTSRVRT